MNYTLIWTYIAGMAASSLFFAAAIFILLDMRRKAASFKELESLIPDACRIPGVRLEIQRLHEEEVSLKERLDEARITILRKGEAEDWLEENEPRIKSGRDELAQTIARLNTLESQMKSIAVERDAIQCEKTELQAECRELQRLQGSLEPLRAAVAQKQEAENWLSQNGPIYDEVKRQLPAMQESLQSAREALDSMTLEREQTEALCREARHQREWLIREENALTTAVDEKRIELEALKSAVEGFEARQAGLQVNLQELEAKLQFREQEVREVQAESQIAESELQEFRREYDQITAELNVKREEIIHLKSAYATTNRLLEAAVKRWGELAPETAGSDEDRLAELWKPALMRTVFVRENTKSEQECLRGTEEYLSSLRLQFHPRVVRAFHTSIKVAEMSPLTVLAGISGTGKSELPRRYAEGMGMHFLNLAVQPRWDSPQDMFGFYNYLENRYRATELSRALVQMDAFYAEPDRGWNFPQGWNEHNLSDRMLLVLLDEMNLARVEYYFSEFLSRLEIRRGINRNNPNERRLAEMALEVGLRTLKRSQGTVIADSQPSLQLFVDSNVLFVGTMNEDETTQTLSDKVVDRANVLRFGRPNKLAALGTGEVPPGDSWLSFERWQSWVNDADVLRNDVRTEVTNWIEDINAALQLIGRPFAHRTFLSMLAYVANYPDDSGNSHHVAMSDQIELKILPKLRGLDPAESSARQSIARLQSVLDQVGDEKLARVFSECVRQSEHQFVWHGVDRVATDE